MNQLASTKQINALKLKAIDKGGYHTMEGVIRMACKLHFKNYGVDYTPKQFLKSIECSLVLQLMDQDFSYQKALGKVLNMDKSINKEKLENELNNYI